MPLIEMSDYNRRARAYWWITTLIGALAFAYSLSEFLRSGNREILTLILFIVAVYLAGLYPIRIPGTQVSISPCDIFIFLAALLGGAATAVILAVTDAFLMSYRTSRRWTSRLGGPAFMSISVFVSAKVFYWTASLLSLLQVPYSAVILSALLLFAILYFLLNSSLLTLLHALKRQTSPWQLWWENYSWAGLTYLASASAAGLIYLAIKEHGLAALLAAIPIVAVIFATSYFYFKQADERAKANQQRIEAAEAQATQAALHAQELRASEERFRSAFHYAAIGMALVATDGQWLQVNRSLCKLLGYEEDELLATSFQSLTHPDDVDTASRHIAQLLWLNASSNSIETRYLHKLGHTVWTLLNVSVVQDSNSNSSRFIFQIQDITDKKRAEQKLAHTALHDALTDLPNRALFIDHLGLAMARAERHREQKFALLLLDFDRFKVINDSLGHLVGDQLLVAIARRLEKHLRRVDTVARLGGDEFTILLEDVKSVEEAIVFADSLQKELSAPFTIEDHEIFTSASIGIALNDSAYKKPEEILRDADTAMYRAKSLGKNKVAQFDKSMHDHALKRLQLETDLRHAVERQEFFVVYQPIVSLDTARLVGFEALVRWQHPVRGLINPIEFISVAEETGYIVPIGQWVLEASCRQLSQWQKQFSEALPLLMSVNLSGKQLAQETIIEQITGTLKQTGVAAQQIKLEITESIVMDNVEDSTLVLDQLRALGIRISVDDFGTGYSSLSYLNRLPVDTLKIDRSFIIQMLKKDENAEIVRTIIQLARNLGMDVIAEGVETTEQLEHLQHLKCDQGQGYLFSKPLPAEAASELVSQLHNWQAFTPSSEALYRKNLLDVSDNTYTM
jgi:diguanylate cyclase (GGDEF)-like protein/PAS domain S-box-containing protein